jgi:glycyl-tRNA synthetase beta chain
LLALRTFLSLPEAAVLAALNKRIANILRKAPPATGVVRVELLLEEAEHRLHAVLEELREPVQRSIAEQRYSDALQALTGLGAAVDGFFAKVMVMDDNLERRFNRLALLREVQELLGGVADLSRLPG